MGRPALNYFGGKSKIAKWIISHFPEHRIYAEPFGGGGSILLRKNPAKRDIYNDIDGEIVNVFKVLRENNAELKEKLRLTPFSRDEYLSARDFVSDPIEQARRTIVKSYMGIGDAIHNKSGFRNSKSSNTSPSVTFCNYVDQLHLFEEKLRRVIIENLDYKLILKKYDSVETLFYIDPPYVHSSRSMKHNYSFEMSDSDHYELIDCIKKLDGMVVLSGYENDIYSELNFNQIKKETFSQKNKKTEIIYIK